MLEIKVEEKLPTFDAIKFEGGVDEAAKVISWFDEKCVQALYEPQRNRVMYWTGSSFFEGRPMMLPADLWVVDYTDLSTGTREYRHYSDEALKKYFNVLA